MRQPESSGLLQFGMLAGMRVHSSSLATTMRIWWSIEGPLPKRRRRWRVVRHEAHDPGAYMLSGDTLVVHPIILEALKECGGHVRL